MWCINPGYCCSKETCKTWGDYISNLNKCRTNGATDRLTTAYLSFVSFIGLSNFYVGKIFAGCCELANGIMALISIFAINNCYDTFRNRYDTDATSCAQMISAGILILDLAKAIHMLTTGSVEIVEITIMILSIMIVYMHCEENNTCRSHGIIVTLQITILTAVLETIRDIYAAKHYDKDGYGCPFV